MGLSRVLGLIGGLVMSGFGELDVYDESRG